MKNDNFPGAWEAGGLEARKKPRRLGLGVLEAPENRDGDFAPEAKR
jgi:hypothetical protein